MLTVEYVRTKYKEEYWDLSDKEVQEVIDFFYTFWYIMINGYKEKWSSIFKKK